MKKTLQISLLMLLAACPVQGFETALGETALQLTWGALYDSNLLRYSQSDRTNFQNETERDVNGPYKSPILALDDLRTDYKLSLELRNKFWKKKSTTLRATADFAHHMMNPIKNLGWISLSARQDLTKDWIGSVGYFYEPRFYIRDYRENPTSTATRQHCEFSMHQAKADLTYRPKMLYDFTGSFKYKAYRYNSYFTEYDGDLLSFGVSAVYRPGDWRFSAGYAFDAFENTGFSSLNRSLDEASLDDSEFGQGDYDEDNFTGTIRYSYIGFRREMNLQASTEIMRRAFTTSRTVTQDKMHSGREDLLVDYSITNQITMTKQFGIELGLGRSSRKSDAPYPNVSVLKNYKRMTAWVELSYELK